MDDNECVTEAETIQNAEKDNLRITNELRAWASQWWRVHLSDDGSMTISSIDTDDPTPTVESIILAMANRIDFMHAHEMTMARWEAIQYLESNVSGQYTKLPVDADGVPIRVGDTVAIFDHKDAHAVETIELTSRGWFVHAGEHTCIPINLHHVQTDSWESIIHDAMKGMELDGVPKTYDGFEELVERCRRLANEDE